jgi:hypothetical protein
LRCLGRNHPPSPAPLQPFWPISPSPLRASLANPITLTCGPTPSAARPVIFLCASLRSRWHLGPVCRIPFFAPVNTLLHEFRAVLVGLLQPTGRTSLASGYKSGPCPTPWNHCWCAGPLGWAFPQHRVRRRGRKVALVARRVPFCPVIRVWSGGCTGGGDHGQWLARAWGVIRTGRFLVGVEELPPDR